MAVINAQNSNQPVIAIAVNTSSGRILAKGHESVRKNASRTQGTGIIWAERLEPTCEYLLRKCSRRHEVAQSCLGSRERGRRIQRQVVILAEETSAAGTDILGEDTSIAKVVRSHEGRRKPVPGAQGVLVLVSKNESPAAVCMAYERFTVLILDRKSVM